MFLVWLSSLSNDDFIKSTTAEPTTMPSEILAMDEAWDGDLIPNPITTGRSVTDLIFFKFVATLSIFGACVPVIPVIDTKYTNPVAFNNILFNLSAFVVGVTSLITLSLFLTASI